MRYTVSPVAQENVDREPAAGRGADVGTERAVGGGVPGHGVADLALVGRCLVDRPQGDDDEPGVVVLQEFQPGELGGRELGAARALPFLAFESHVGPVG